MEDESRVTRHSRSVDVETTKTIKKASFRQLFSREELWYYGIAALVYIGLGLLLQNWVLNVEVGILFILAWMWIVPKIFSRLSAKRLRSLFYLIFKRTHSVYTRNPQIPVTHTDMAKLTQNRSGAEIGEYSFLVTLEDSHEKVEIK